jgi:hypothetical protein
MKKLKLITFLLSASLLLVNIGIVNAQNWSGWRGNNRNGTYHLLREFGMDCWDKAHNTDWRSVIRQPTDLRLLDWPIRQLTDYSSAL